MMFQNPKICPFDSHFPLGIGRPVLFPPPRSLRRRHWRRAALRRVRSFRSADFVKGLNPSQYTLWLFNIAMEAMALIEIDGLPFLIAWWIFPWRTVSHNQMVAAILAVFYSLLSQA